MSAKARLHAFPHRTAIGVVPYSGRYFLARRRLESW